YAMLGDVQIAEPGALIGFAGARVIEQTIREKLPEGFQRAEYLKDHGMVDMVVHRHDLRPTLARLCRLLTKSPAPETASRPAPQVAIQAQIAPAADVAAAGAARSSRTQLAAGDPRRRHQRQGFDHRLSARDSGSRPAARPRLYLALPGADQRMLSPRQHRRRRAGRR